ncbi:MAG: SDR family oxidoreductase [Pirellula sp.]
MFNSTNDLSSKPVAWITGSGAARIGRSIAQHFANHGYRIVIHANHSRDSANEFADELRRQGRESMLVYGPIEQPDFARNAVAQIVEEFARIDVLVNSAAIWDWKNLEATTAMDLQRQWEVNTLGTFLCSQAAGLQMVEQPTGGAIILIGDWAVQRPYPDFSAYFASKGCIETMTRTLAVELATRNPAIRVNAILPGTVLLDASVSEEQAARVNQQSLLKGPGRPEYVAQAAYFLATHEYITGVCLPVDGGRSIHAGASFDAMAHAEYGNRNTLPIPPTKKKL